MSTTTPTIAQTPTINLFELRLGSIVYHSNWDSETAEPTKDRYLCKVGRLGFGHINFSTMDGAKGMCSTAILFPVPVTDEIMTGVLGVQMNGFLQYEFDISRNEADYYTLSVDLRGGMIWLREGMKDSKRIEDDITALWNRDFTPSLYLHQLQNIYLVLTGKELPTNF